MSLNKILVQLKNAQQDISLLEPTSANENPDSASRRLDLLRKVRHLVRTISEHMEGIVEASSGSSGNHGTVPFVLLRAYSLFLIR